MRRAYDVAAVRAAEAVACSEVGGHELMMRAAAGLAAMARQVLTAGGGIVGSRVVLLVGSGNNGGDALYAGAILAGRGARVEAVQVFERCHEAGLAGLRAAGGRVLQVCGEADLPNATQAVRDADLVIDGILGIGGRGALPEPAATLVRAADSGAPFRIAVDVPSGVDADTGEVADAEAVFRADMTVTFGCLKPGLVTAPGRDHAGAVEIVDIGITTYLPPVPAVRVLQHGDLAQYVQPPGPGDHKYSRGVVGVVAGSARYPGAGLLAVSGARRSGVGMVRFADRGDGVSDMVMRAFPDVVLQHEHPADDPRVTSWVVGPGLGESRSDERWLLRVLAADVPVVMDADALRMYVASGDVRAQVASRIERGALTVLTPHGGEFAALFPDAGSESRIAAARSAAEQTGCLLVLKGSGTVVAGARGAPYVDPIAAHELATAGSGDVLSGMIGGFLAHRAAKQRTSESARCVAAAVYTHSLAARLAAAGGRPVVATDIADHVADAIMALRGAAERVL